MREPVGRIHQCPHCELRFAFHAEVEDHLRVDHPAPVDDDLRSPPPTSEPALDRSARRPREQGRSA